MTLLQLAALSVMMATVTSVGGFLPGEVSPDNPAVQLGATVVLNCTLHEYDKNLTSSDMYFMYASRRIPSNYTEILDKWTIQMRFPNVSKEFNQKIIFCYAGYPFKTLIGMQVVVIILKPHKPRITECRIKDSAMKCTWSPTGNEQTQNFIQSKVTDELSWKVRGSANNTWIPCPRQSSGTCEWPYLNDTTSVYLIKFFTYSFYDNVTVNYTVDSSRIIEVAQVQSLTETHLSASSLKMEWPWVKGTDEIVYRVNFSHSSIGYSDMSRLINTNETTLNGLTPFQPYDFSVEAKTKLGGYWSKPYRSEVFSRSDVPARNPEVKMGAFTSTEKDGDPCVEVTLYWQRLSLREQHGPNFSYAVNVTHVSGCTDSCDSRNKAASHVKLMISALCTFEVTVTSVNVNGTSLASRSPVRIEPTVKRIAGPSNITAIASNDTAVTLRWNTEPNSSQTTGYTIYWCHSLHHVCKNQIDWVSVSANTYEVVVNLPEKFDKYEFAVSREEGRHSSGMVLGDCIYQDDKYSPPPQDFIIPETGSGELVLEWKPPQCHIHRGFVYGYELSYCRTNEESGCPTDTPLEKLIVSSTEVKVVLSGLTEHARYCVTTRSLTAKGPSQWPGGPQCAVVDGRWWTTGRIVGFAIGSVLVLALVIFGIIRFWSHCHRLYSKFQQGIRVELPHTSYSTQFSVSSQRGLIDQNHSFSYNVEDFSTPGLAKQNSQESTADSGRGSMSQDHIHHSMRRSNSGESDEVFLGKLAPHSNGTSRSRQLSEPMANYVRVSEPDAHNGSALSLGNSTSDTRPKLPPRKIPPKEASPSSVSNSSHNYHPPSPTSGSIPSYVVVGEHSHPGAEYSSVKDDASHCSGSYSSPIPDYIKAPGGNSALNYITPDNQNEEEYLTTPDADTDKNPLGYVTSPEAANQGAPLRHVPRPEAAAQGAPGGYITSPEAAMHGPPEGYVTSPDAANQGPPAGYVTCPEAANQGAPLGYVTNPGIANQGPTGEYITSPEAANQGAPLGYVTSPEAANQGAPLGYVASPEAANQGAPLGYVASPEAANQGAPLGYVASPEAANQGAPLGYVASPEAANQGAPLGYVASPEAANQGVPVGYVTSPPGMSSDDHAPQSIGSTQHSNPPADYVTGPNVEGIPSNDSNVGGYVSHNVMPSLTGPPPLQGYLDKDSQNENLSSSDYVSGEDIPSPLAVSTPNAYMSANGSEALLGLPSPDHTATSAGSDRHFGSPNKPHMLQSQSSPDYVSLPTKDSNSLPTLVHGANKAPVTRSSDANHNDVTNTGSYVRPETMNGMEPYSETSQNLVEAQTEAPEDQDETSFLLPPDGGRKVLNKSGYVVIDT